MVDHEQIYQQEGDKYQRLIAREDYTENLLPAIQDLVSVTGLDIVDLGTGTGRLASQVGPASGRTFAFDRSFHMLGVAANLLSQLPMDHSLIAAADHRAIPLPQDSADVILSGWSFCYLAIWGGKEWKFTLQDGLREIKRVLRAEGSVILIESLGTGNTEPQLPDQLKPYISYLEDCGFQRSWIRTDYQFRNMEEAQDLTAFFFGEEMLQNIQQEPEPILPECTGLWSCPAVDLKIGME